MWVRSISFRQGLQCCCAEVNVNESTIGGIQKKEEDILRSVCETDLKSAGVTVIVAKFVNS